MATTKRAARKGGARKSTRTSTRRRAPRRVVPTYRPNDGDYGASDDTKTLSFSCTFPAFAADGSTTQADGVNAYRHTNGVLGIEFGCRGWGREDEWRSGGAKHDALVDFVLEGAKDENVSAADVTKAGSTYNFGEDLADAIADLSNDNAATDEALLRALKDHLDPAYLRGRSTTDTAQARQRVSRGIDVTLDWIAALLPA